MANPVKVAELLLNRCEDLAGTWPNLPVAMPDTAFTPPSDENGPLPYLRVDLYSNAPFWEGLASGRLDQGLLQITVVWPEGQGIIKHRDAAADVMAAFPKGLTLYGAGVRVRVNREPWAASPILDASMTLTPITIPWVAS